MTKPIEVYVEKIDACLRQNNIFVTPKALRLLASLRRDEHVKEDQQKGRRRSRRGP